MNLLTCPSESQVMSTSVPSRVGRFVQAADRHDREKLPERPMIEQRLENGKIAKILIAEAVFELADFLGDIAWPVKALDHFLADFPIKRFDLRFVRQVEHAQRKHVLGVFLALGRVMKGLQLVQLGEFFRISSRSFTSACSFSPNVKFSARTFFRSSRTLPRSTHCDAPRLRGRFR